MAAYSYIEKQCISSSDSDTDSTVISNSEGSQYVETDQCDFEEMVINKISDGNTFGGIVEPYRFKPYASLSDEDGDNGGVREDENTGRMQIKNFLCSVTPDWSVLFFCSIEGL